MNTIGKSVVLNTMIMREEIIGEEITLKLYKAGTLLYVIDSRFSTDNYVAVTTNIDGVPNNRRDVAFINNRDIVNNESTWFFVNTANLSII